MEGRMFQKIMSLSQRKQKILRRLAMQIATLTMMAEDQQALARQLREQTTTLLKQQATPCGFEELARQDDEKQKCIGSQSGQHQWWYNLELAAGSTVHDNEPRPAPDATLITHFAQLSKEIARAAHKAASLQETILQTSAEIDDQIRIL